jgi:hypothetical protein
MTKFSGNNQEQIITLNDWALLSDQSKENFLKLSSGYDALQSALDIQNNNVTKLDNEIDRLDKELDTAQEENKRYKLALEHLLDYPIGDELIRNIKVALNCEPTVQSLFEKKRAHEESVDFINKINGD